MTIVEICAALVVDQELGGMVDALSAADNMLAVAPFELRHGDPVRDGLRKLALSLIAMKAMPMFDGREPTKDEKETIIHALRDAAKERNSGRR